MDACVLTSTRFCSFAACNLQSYRSCRLCVLLSRRSFLCNSQVMGAGEREGRGREPKYALIKPSFGAYWVSLPPSLPAPMNSNPRRNRLYEVCEAVAQSRPFLSWFPMVVFMARKGSAWASGRQVAFWRRRANASFRASRASRKIRHPQAFCSIHGVLERTGFVFGWVPFALCLTQS